VVVVFVYGPKFLMLGTSDLGGITVGAFSFISADAFTQGLVFLVWEKRRGMHVISKGNLRPTLYAVNKNSAY
jgi:hypothetical protein